MHNLTIGDRIIVRAGIGNIGGYVESVVERTETQTTYLVYFPKINTTKTQTYYR